MHDSAPRGCSSPQKLKMELNSWKHLSGDETTSPGERNPRVRAVATNEETRSFSRSLVLWGLSFLWMSRVMVMMRRLCPPQPLGTIVFRQSEHLQLYIGKRAFHELSISSTHSFVSTAELTSDGGVTRTQQLNTTSYCHFFQFTIKIISSIKNFSNILIAVIIFKNS